MKQNRKTKLREMPDQELNHLMELYQKLKNFYAQPLDGYWPLRPKWVPDITKWHGYVSPLRGDKAPQLTKFRRFTFEEFCEIYSRKEWADARI